MQKFHQSLRGGRHESVRGGGRCAPDMLDPSPHANRGSHQIRSTECPLHFSRQASTAIVHRFPSSRPHTKVSNIKHSISPETPVYLSLASRPRAKVSRLGRTFPLSCGELGSDAKLQCQAFRQPTQGVGEITRQDLERKQFYDIFFAQFLYFYW